MTSLWVFAVRRILQLVPIVLSVVIINFFIIHAAPGDPAVMLAGDSASPTVLAELRARMGLDKPLLNQFAIYITNVLHGNLGFSYFYNQPVLPIVLNALANTLLLVSVAILWASVVGIILGVISSTRKSSKADAAITITTLVGYFTPVFWLAIVILLFFSEFLGILPTEGMVTVGRNFTGPAYVADVLAHLALPALTVGLVHLSLVTRLTRASMLEALKHDYIITAMAKGLPQRTVVIKHALRNALLPTWTAIGFNFGFMLAGASLTEVVFGWPGVGLLMFNAIGSRDYPILLGILVVISALIILANLVTDLVYAFLDPRVRLGGK